MQWAVIFHKQHIHFKSGLDSLFFYNSELNRAGRILPCKLSCVKCKAPIADEGRRMFLAFGPLFDFPAGRVLPEAFRPTCHLFYGSRVLDCDDELPKYLGHKGYSPLYQSPFQRQ